MKKLNEIEQNKIAYNCRKATYLIEKKQWTRISRMETMELKMHLAGCSVCRIFEQQSVMINSMVQSIFSGKETIQPKLDDLFKSELQKRIDQQANKS